MPCVLLAQPAFDSASIKPSLAGLKMEMASRTEITPGSVTMMGTSLRSTVAWAYGVREDQVAGPDWIGAGRYDVIAKAAGPSPVSDLKLMMQALLAERFALALHRAGKEGQVFAITVAPDGPKLTLSAGPGPAKVAVSNSVIIFQHYTLPELADRLSAGPFSLSKPVVDRTGIAGAYDLTVHTGANMDEMNMTAERVALGKDLPDYSPYFTAFREAGLKLEARKEAVETLVIDRAERTPKAN
jgi:uncharacterized protein (TIGR03435 family)